MSTTYSNPLIEDTDKIIALLKSEHGDLTKLELNRFIIAKQNGTIIGCIRTKNLSDDCIELSSLVVSEDNREKGIGTKLIQEILNKDKRRPIYLLCMRNKQSFYERSGFNLMQIKDLPDILRSEYERVTKKMPQERANIISMCIN